MRIVFLLLGLLAGNTEQVGRGSSVALGLIIFPTRELGVVVGWGDHLDS